MVGFPFGVKPIAIRAQCVYPHRDAQSFGPSCERAGFSRRCARRVGAHALPWGHPISEGADARHGRSTRAHPSCPDAILRRGARLVPRCLSRAHAVAGVRLGRYRGRRERAGHRTHRLGQDACCVPVRHRRAYAREGGDGGFAEEGASRQGRARAVHLAAEGARGGRGAQLAGAARRASRRAWRPQAARCPKCARHAHGRHHARSAP